MISEEILAIALHHPNVQKSASVGENTDSTEIHCSYVPFTNDFKPSSAGHASGADPGFGQGGAPASEAENCRPSEAESRERSEQSVAGVQGPLKGPGSFWVFNAQICILTHSRDSFSLIFDIYFDTKC